MHAYLCVCVFCEFTRSVVLGLRLIFFHSVVIFWVDLVDLGSIKHPYIFWVHYFDSGDL